MKEKELSSDQSQKVDQSKKNREGFIYCKLYFMEDVENSSLAVTFVSRIFLKCCAGYFHVQEVNIPFFTSDDFRLQLVQGRSVADE